MNLFITLNGNRIIDIFISNSCWLIEIFGQGFGITKITEHHNIIPTKHLIIRGRKGKGLFKSGFKEGYRYIPINLISYTLNKRKS